MSDSCERNHRVPELTEVLVNGFVSREGHWSGAESLRSVTTDDRFTLDAVRSALSSRLKCTTRPRLELGVGAASASNELDAARTGGRRRGHRLKEGKGAQKKKPNKKNTHLQTPPGCFAIRVETNRERIRSR